jgi:hypothetical protein
LQSCFDDLEFTRLPLCYDNDVMVVETAYPFTLASTEAAAEAALEGASIWPVTPVRVGSQRRLVHRGIAHDESLGEQLKRLRATRALGVLDDVRMIPVVETEEL